MGSAAVQGELWGAKARDFARFLEQTALPLFGAALDAAAVTEGTKLLDAGCGAGLVALLARLRGAVVSGLDASPALLDVARERLPEANLLEGDLEELPFPNDSFDAVTAVNSIFYAADIDAAMRELVRVARHGGRVVVTAWGPAERSDLLRTVFPKLGPLMPPSPPGVTPHRPGTLSEPGAMAGLLERAGLRVLSEGETACPLVFPNSAIAWRANASAGPNQTAIEHSGEEAVRAAWDEAFRAHMLADGSVRFENIFLWAAGERP